ncbi:MAG: hypothetical protein AB7I42_24030 [Bradyrhizobium sp.]|uniref:hypothetical protein n=1 Tax=Bradyrhizobium sp. TaxID=376 RepID=UPI003D10C4AC
MTTPKSETKPPDIACPRCMPPGDPCCQYCGGTYGVPAPPEPSDPPTPEVGKVYWVRLGGNAPFRAEILTVSPKVIEYRNNNWSGVRSAIMREDLEIVEETTWE